MPNYKTVRRVFDAIEMWGQFFLKVDDELAKILAVACRRFIDINQSKFLAEGFLFLLRKPMQIYLEQILAIGLLHRHHLSLFGWPRVQFQAQHEVDLAQEAGVEEI